VEKIWEKMEISFHFLRKIGEGPFKKIMKLVCSRDPGVWLILCCFIALMPILKMLIQQKNAPKKQPCSK
jgi:hypothetical protein